MNYLTRAKIVLFCALIGLPFILRPLGLASQFDAQIEGREPNRFPVIKWKPGNISLPSKSSMRTFPRAFDRYLADRMPFRNAIHKLQVALRFEGFELAQEAYSRARSESPSHVLIGKEGWTFYTGNKSITQLEGKLPFSDSELANWRDCLVERNEFCRSLGIRYVVMIGPDKGTIYPEYLPDLVILGQGPSRLDCLCTALHAPEVTVLDVRPALRAMKSTQQVYYTNDTHWNEIGGLVACNQLLAFLGRPTTELNEFTINPDAANSVADEFDLAGRSHPPRMQQLVPRVPFRYQKLEHPSEAKIRSATMDNPHGTGRAVVFHDSFFPAMEPCFSASFRHAEYRVTDDFDAELVLKTQPEVVVQIMVERKLNQIVLKPLNPPAMAAGKSPIVR